MDKKRQTKIISIIALVIAIVGMTLGFAAFSATLNISSSAAVTPSASDFKMVVYGFKDEESLLTYQETHILNDSYLSDSMALPVPGGSDAEIARIDNTSLVISNLKANFTNESGEVVYPFVIRNEGKYDAYLDLSNILLEDRLVSSLDATCIAEGDATESLVDAACNGLEILIGVMDMESLEFKVITEDYYKIDTGNYEVIVAVIGYRGPYADGPFTATFPEFKLNFSTAK